MKKRKVTERALPKEELFQEKEELVHVVANWLLLMERARDRELPTWKDMERRFGTDEPKEVLERLMRMNPDRSQKILGELWTDLLLDASLVSFQR